jgi:hypothetical protein
MVRPDRVRLAPKGRLTVQHTSQQSRHISRQTLRRVTALALAALVTFGATAGGNREDRDESQRPTPPQQESTRIEIDEGNAVERAPENGDESRDNGEASAGDTERTSPAQPLWAMVDHPLESNIVRNISAVIEDGYVPVGYDETDDAAAILYAKSSRVLFDRWIIHEFTDLSSLDEEFSTFLIQGWTPMDISVTESGLSAMFVRGEDESEIAGWRIHQIPVEELDTALGILQGYREGGFLPYGVSINQETDDFWFLMIQLEGWEDREPSRIAFNAFPLDETEAGITEDVENGLLPWGLARGRETAFVLYLF